jgi:phosphoserine aminotransferase
VLGEALSHRAPEGRARLKLALDQTRTLLRLPSDYRIAIVPGSDTGAFEMAMWSLLGPRAVDVLAWESFGAGWEADVTSQLRLNVRTLAAPYGKLPDLAKVDFTHDVVFAWNGTTSGVRVPDARWIPSDRQGLTLVDATSAVFAQAIDWAKTDAVTFSWQKVLGGEAAHGMLILSPRAVERLESHSPSWPLPKLFRMVKSGRLDAALFEGETINTPSMLCVEDYLDALSWAEAIDGLDGLFARSAVRLDRAHHLDLQPRGRSGDTLQYLRLPEPRRCGNRGAFARSGGTLRQGHGRAARPGRCRQGHRLLSRRASRLAHLDRSDGGGGRSRSLDTMARLGLCRDQTFFFAMR